MSRFSSSLDTASIEARLDELRRKVDTLMHEQVNPAVSRVAHQAQDLAGQVSRTARREADTVAGVVRDRPVATIAVAVGVGYLLARLLRR